MDIPTLTLGLLVVIAIGVVVGVLTGLDLLRLTRRVVRTEPLGPTAADAESDAATRGARFVYLHGGGPPRGPVDLMTLRAMHLDGRLGDDALAAVEGGDRWWPLSELLRRASPDSGRARAVPVVPPSPPTPSLGAPPPDSGRRRPGGTSPSQPLQLEGLTPCQPTSIPSSTPTRTSNTRPG